MKIFLKNFLLFFMVGAFLYVPSLLLVDILLPKVYKPNILYQAGDGLVQRKIRESDTISANDVLFLGSSHAYNSFDPAIFERMGIKSYNWGTSQQTHPQTRMVLNEYLSKLNPKLVVYEVFPEIFATSGRASMADFLNAPEPFNVGFLEIFEFENSIVLLNTYLVKHTRKLLHLEEQTRAFNYKDQYYRGYLKREINETPVTDTIQIKWTPQQNQLIAFEENLNLLKENNVPYILVIAPYNFKYKNQDKIRTYLESKGELYDYNELLEFNKIKDFSGIHHISHSGAKKMNSHLMHILKKKLKK